MLTNSPLNEHRMQFHKLFKEGIRTGSITGSQHFKTNVVKLNQLGLTLSLETGCRLSQRGEDLLRRP